MWEFEQYKGGIDELSKNLDLASSTKSFTINSVHSASMILWTEHCSECSYPSCYETCDLYEPRFDLHCRTLKFGIKKSYFFSSIRPYSALVAPKDWATLDATINLYQIPFGALRLFETTDYLIAHLLKTISTAFYQISPKKKLLRGFEFFRTILIDALSLKKKLRTPDAFLLQIYNASESKCNLSLKFSNFPRKRDTILFQKLFLLDQGINEFVLPYSEISTYLDINRRIRAYISIHACEAPFLFFAAADFVVFAESIQQKPENIQNEKHLAKIKCIVWDLDNTIWGGILLEHPEGVKLKKDVINLLKTLDSRGIVHSIASKNNYEDAMAMLEKLGINELFLYPQISWSPKSESIKRIVAEINIGMNTIAFVDDSEFELREVASQLPEVTTVNSEDMVLLADDPRYSGSASSDSSKRRYFYKAEEKRKNIHKAFSGDYNEFLLSCHMRIEIRNPREKDLGRLHELVQRTNQLNFTGNRYTKDDLVRLLHSPHLDCFLITCNDDFGDYGTVGFCIIEFENAKVTVNELAISCRVQGKRVEQMLFKNLMQTYEKKGYDTLYLVFKETGKNTPAMSVIEDMWFEPFLKEDGKTIFRVQMSTHEKIVDTAIVKISMVH
jgi:FkbH-like protein